MHDDYTKHVGLDVHAKSIEVAIVDSDGESRRFGRVPNRPAAIRELVRRLSPDGEVLCFWHEAGPTGYGLFRQLTELGHDCNVVAAALVPRKPGDRVKTDRRDALALARLGRAGELTPVWVPDPQQEAMRDLTRCRENAVCAQRVARQQLGSFLLRHGRLYTDGQKNKWTRAFFVWLDQQHFEEPVQQAVFEDYRQTVRETTERVERLTERIRQSVRHWSLGPTAAALRALRGVDVVAAATIMAEIGDLTRFDSPRQLAAFLGLVPSEHSSGPRRRQGRITRAGNTHVRRVLIEGSWSYRHPARMTAHMRRKASPAPEPVQAIAWKAQQRLCGRYHHLINRGKLKVQTCTAVARELTGFIWAIAQHLGPPVRPGAGRTPAEPSVTL